MDAFMIASWNRKVTENDTVYILGDVSWHRKDKTAEILKQLNGKKILVKGNHDNRWLNTETKSLFDSIVDYAEIKIENNFIVLSHYPIPFFNKHHYGSYMLYGHVHNSHEWNMVESYKREMQQLDISCNMYNVGCMLWNYEPVSLEEIISDERFKPVLPEGKE